MLDLLFFGVHTFAPLAFLAFWIASAGWTLSDTSHRCPERRRFWGAAAIALPLAGAALYALVRPCHDDRSRRERDVWRRFLEAELDPGDRCLACLTPLQASFVCCPGCGDALRTRCADCGTLLRIGWRACPECAQPMLPARPLQAPVRVAA
jgi:hypothetical protein